MLAAVLMLAGLLIPAGFAPERTLDEAQAVSRTQVGRKLGAAKEALVYLPANPRALLAIIGSPGSKARLAS